MENTALSSALLVALPPILQGLAAFAASLDRTQRPRHAPRVVEGLALLALATAIAAAVAVAVDGPASVGGMGLVLRLDAVTATLLLLIAFIGWVVLRYSATYLDGEPRQGPFLVWISLTLAAVMLLVSAGHLLLLLLAWVATSLALHRLLLFYPERPGARRAARKKWLVARTGDVALAAAAGLLVLALGSGDLAVIAERAGEGGAAVMSAAALLAFAAILKSAQLPTHGWLTEVMEAPTPVSALLHAGVINAGGVLLIRLAEVMLAAPGVLAVLAMLGGFTALVGGLVMLTQSAVKTSLAWSTIAQMGFMILQCGLGLFTLALLHIVAHSLYKAHAFLAAGGAVERAAAHRRAGPVAVPGGVAVLRAFLLALGIYAVIGLLFWLLFGLEGKSPQSLALGAILILGVAYLVAQGLADAAPRALTLRTALASLATAVGYFALQTGAEALYAGTLPAPPPPGALEWALIVLALLSFAAVAVAQALFPLWAVHPAATGIRVHLANGLYANAVFDRLIGGWRQTAPPRERGSLNAG